MDSFEINKVIGGLLGTVFVIFSVGIVSDALFASSAPETPGFAIEATEAEASAGGAAAAPEAKPIGELLAHADATAGEAVFKKCTACHSGEKGGPNKVGPDLWDIVDRPVAHHEGFSYSAAMKDFAKGGEEKWTYDNLDHFLHAPKKFIKGTAMGFAGLPKDAERANLIAYLRTLSDDPKPLPAADASDATEAAPAEGAAPAEAAPAEAAPAQDAAPVEGAAPAEGEAQPAPAEEAQPAPAQ